MKKATQKAKTRGRPMRGWRPWIGLAIRPAKRWLLLGVFAYPLGAGASPPGQPVQELLETQKERIEAAGRTQAKVDAESDAAATLLESYRATQEEILAQKAQNQRLSEQVEAQRQELRAAEEALLHAAAHRQSFAPMLKRMLGVLDRFTALDLPFLPKERKDRSEALHDLLQNPSSSLAQRTRRLLEAYLIEMQYAQHLESYEDQIQINQETVSVQILRVGRVGMFYVTLDEAQAGRFDPKRRRFVPLSAQYIATLSRGIDIAKKRLAPELIEIPLIRREADEEVNR